MAGIFLAENPRSWRFTLRFGCVDFLMTIIEMGISRQLMLSQRGCGGLTVRAHSKDFYIHDLSQASNLWPKSKAGFWEWCNRFDSLMKSMRVS
jgi:hypothetical protein